MFADPEDVAARLGRPLTTSEEPMVEFLLEAASEVVANAADREASDITDPPRILRFVTVEVVVRAMANPSGIYSQTETLGDVSRSQTFRKEVSSDLFLTDMEERLVRRAILGQLSGTGQSKSLVNDPIVMRGLAPTAYVVCEGS